jgi:hypothetical protein
MIIEGGKATVTDDAIHAFIYMQDGTMSPLTLPNTMQNQLFVQWLQRHDRYTSHGDDK